MYIDRSLFISLVEIPTAFGLTIHICRRHSYFWLYNTWSKTLREAYMMREELRNLRDTIDNCLSHVNQ
jgi:hypothetical protein